MPKTYMGWEVTLENSTTGSPADYSTVGMADQVTFTVSKSSENYYCFGDDEPHEVLGGQKEISGSLEKLVTNNEIFKVMDNDTEMLLRATLDTDREVELTGVKITDWEMDVPEDGDVAESVDFEASSIDFPDTASTETVSSSTTTSSTNDTTTSTSSYSTSSLDAETEEDDEEETTEKDSEDKEDK